MVLHPLKQVQVCVLRMNPLGFVQVSSVVTCAAGHHGPTKGASSPVPLVQLHGNEETKLLQLLKIEIFHRIR